MANLSGAWSQRQLEEFLEETSVPIRLAVHRGDGSLWMVALWYRYENGTFECATPAEAAVVTFLRSDSAVAFDVSTNQPLYRGVRGHGNVSLSADEGQETLRVLIDRYGGKDTSALAEQLLSELTDVVRIRIQPVEMFSWDYSG